MKDKKTKLEIIDTLNNVISKNKYFKFISFLLVIIAILEYPFGFVSSVYYHYYPPVNIDFKGHLSENINGINYSVIEISSDIDKTL